MFTKVLTLTIVAAAIIVPVIGKVSADVPALTDVRMEVADTAYDAMTK